VETSVDSKYRSKTQPTPEEKAILGRTGKVGGGPGGRCKTPTMGGHYCKKKSWFKGGRHVGEKKLVRGAKKKKRRVLLDFRIRGARVFEYPW